MHRFKLVALAVTLALPVGAQTRMTISPAQPAPGAIVQLALRDAGAGAAITSIHGTMAGEPLHFVSTGTGRWHALGGIPVDASGTITAHAIIQRAGKVIDTVSARVAIPKVRVATSRLNVD